jgi:DNA polymerase-1
MTDLARPNTPQAESRPASPSAVLLLVDGHAYAYRAFYAIRQLSAPSGSPANAIFGFIKMLAKLRQRLQPTHIGVVWDGGLAAERLEALPEYKAQRPPMPSALEAQIDEIVTYLEAEGLASLCQEGVEADDWIATLAGQAEAVGTRVIIASSDKDFMQLVSDRVGLVNPNDKTESIWSAPQVREKTGVEPGQIVDWLSLIGDSVDNIPGVPGVGARTATELLKRFGNVESLYQRLGEVAAQKMRGNLQAAAAQVRRNQQLIRLKTDVASPFGLEALAVRAPNPVRLRELFAGWGFKSMLRQLEESATLESGLFELARPAARRPAPPAQAHLTF